jgi:hypothetical protein
MSDGRPPICEFCGGYIQAVRQECPALDAAECDPDPYG